MKRSILIIAVLYLISGKLYSQNAFYDVDYFTKISIHDLQNILFVSDLNYVKDIPIGTDHKGNLIYPSKAFVILSTHERETVEDFQLFIDNPFNDTISTLDKDALQSAINKYNNYVVNHNKSLSVGGGNTKNFTSMGIAGSLLTLIPNLLGGNYSLNKEQQTKIIDGLTKYFAEEFRKAQLITYMQGYKTMAEKVPELTVIFPQTIKKLSTADPSKFPELGDEYKTIFNEDLKNIPNNLINHIEGYKGNTGSKDDLSYLILNRKNVDSIRGTEVYKYFNLSVDIASKLANNFQLPDFLEYLDNQYYKPEYITTNDSNLHKLYLAIHGFNLLQRNLIDSPQSISSQYAIMWINLVDLRKLDNGLKWKYFAGLLYQQDKPFFNRFFFNGTGKSLKSISDDDIKKLKKLTSTVITALTEIKTFQANLTNENIKDNYLGYMRLIVNTLNTSVFLDTLNINQVDFNRFKMLSEYTLNLYDNARKKDFSNTIYYTTSIIKEFFRLKPDDKVLANIEKYGSFMADVVNSEDSDQVKEVIKKHAAPPTSFILKREYPFTLSFTGQPGYFISAEKLNGDNQKFKFVSGISLPLGFEASFKVKRGRENAGSINLFAQLIDIGAILNFRLDDSTSTLPDQVNFKQLFSPGGALTYGFKNSPLVLGVGYQFTPELREVTQNGNQFYENGHRIFLKVAWDIPLINIAKCRKK